jgi:hypothetical protein
MLLVGAREPRSEGSEPAVLPKHTRIWALGGLAFGTWDTFHRQALRWPLDLRDDCFAFVRIPEREIRASNKSSNE